MEYTEASRLSAAARSFSVPTTDRKSTRLNSSHSQISYAVFCLKKKKKAPHRHHSEGDDDPARDRPRRTAEPPRSHPRRPIRPARTLTADSLARHLTLIHPRDTR